MRAFESKSLLNSLRNFFRNLILIKNMFKFDFMIKRSRSLQKLKKLRAAYSGETFYIVGAGPSLSEIDLNLLENKNIISLHFSYAAFEQINLNSHFWVVGAESRMSDLAEVPREQFTGSIWGAGSLARRNYPFYAFSAEDILVPVVYSCKLFKILQYRGFLDKNESSVVNKDISVEVPSGLSVIFLGIQLAFFLGAKKIILLGADFGPSPNGAENNFYFSENVPVVDGDMVIGEDPYKERYEKNIRPALLWYRNFLQINNVSIANATQFSRDDVLERVDLSESL